MFALRYPSLNHRKTLTVILFQQELEQVQHRDKYLLGEYLALYRLLIQQIASDSLAILFLYPSFEVYADLQLHSPGKVLLKPYNSELEDAQQLQEGSIATGKVRRRHVGLTIPLEKVIQCQVLYQQLPHYFLRLHVP